MVCGIQCFCDYTLLTVITSHWLPEELQLGVRFGEGNLNLDGLTIAHAAKLEQCKIDGGLRSLVAKANGGSVSIMLAGSSLIE